MGVLDDYYKAKAKRKNQNIAPEPAKTIKPTLTPKQQAEIAPLLRQANRVYVPKSKDEDKLDFFQKGAFEDGYQFGDVTKTILGTAGDAGLNVVKGVASLGEGLGDLVNYGVAGIADLAGKDKWADDVRKRTQENLVDKVTKRASDKLDKYSVLGRTSDSAMQAVGQVGGIILTGGLGSAAGLSSAGVSALTTGVMGLSGMGSGMGEAYEGGATDGEAFVYGAISGAADALTEMVFGGLGKGINALGFSKGLSSADDMLAKTVSNKFKSQIAKNLAEFGVKSSAEGLEEVLAGVLQAAGKKATYMSEKDFKDILEDENLLEQFIVGSFASGAIQSGLIPGTKNGSLIDANQKGYDFIDGMPQNEHPIKEDVVNDRPVNPADSFVAKEEVKPTEEKPTEVKPKRVLYTGSPNTDIQQFKVGGVDGSRQTGDRYGRGIYLTTNEGTAKNYAGESGRVYSVNADELNIFDLNEPITPEMADNLRNELSGADTQVRNSILRNFRTEMEFDDFDSAEQFFREQNALWKEQDGQYSANKPEIKSADHNTGKAVIEFTDFANWENNISNLTGNQLYDALKSISTDDFSSFITGHGFDGIAFNEDADNQQYVIYRNEDRLRIDNGEMDSVAENSTQPEKTQLTEENSTPNATVSETESVADSELKDLYDQKQVLEDTLESLTAVADFGEKFNELSQRWAEVNERIKTLNSESVANIVKELSNQDVGELKPGKADVFEINGYTIRRFFSIDGKQFRYTIVSPYNTSRGNTVDADITEFYDDVEKTLASLIESDSSLAPEKPVVPADAPYRVVPGKPGDSLEKGTFDAPQKQSPKTARVLTKMPEQTTNKSAKKTDSLNVEPKAEKGKVNPLKKFAEYVIDNGFVFERLGKKTKNRELEAKWDGIRRVRSAANHLIGEGLKFRGVKSLKSMMETAEKAGLTQDFYNYLAHYRNVDGMTLDTRYNTYNKGVFGEVSAEESQFEVNRLESLHPEFKEWAEDVYAYNNYLRDLMVKGRLISQKTADLLAEMYPHYVPIHRVGFDGELEVDTENHVGVNSPLKSATGGNQDIMPLFETMAERTMAVYRAVAMNNFGLELYNTLYPGRLTQNTSLDPSASNVGSMASDVDVDYSIDGFDPREELLQSGKLGSLPTFSVFIDGERHTFDINEEIYTAMKPTSDFLSMNIRGLSDISDLRRNLITAYSPWFTLKNAIKDFQEIVINSQHPLRTYATLPEALMQLASKGTKYQEYVENGGEHITYFDTDDSSFDTKKKIKDKVEDFYPLRKILDANNFIETLPRLAEFIASRSEGRSVEVSMLDAARVTTNFGAGGKLTKLLDRNGCTFLNSSVQGFTQQVRNVAEAQQNGLKGWAGLAARYVVAGLPAVLLNNLLWDDDEDYQDLPDYITNNYYVVWKYGDGQFVRIPKGRTAAVIQNAIEQVAKQSNGDDEADWNEFFKLFIENVAPNNPLTDNVLAPIIQTATNTTWYGEDIIPYRLKDLPAEEQFDEKTDSLSVWLGEKLGKSPKKINYLLDQYSGVVGDTVLPYLTPKAESPIDDPALKAIAPLRDIFTTDSTLNNRVTGDFYDTLEEVEAKAESPDATPEDKFLSSYLISTNAEVSKLMKEQREIQTSDRPDSEKYRLNKELKKQINELQEKALEGMNDIYVEGNYAEAGGKRFNLGTDSETGESRWFEVTPKKADGTDNKYYLKEQAVTHAFGVSYKDYWNNKEAYDDAFYIASGYDNEDGGEGSIMETVKNVFGIDTFASFAGGLADIKSDYDDEGNAIKGSRKKKLREYISGLDISAAEKYILYKSQYNWDNSHNYEILDYLNDRKDIEFADKLTICEELGFTVGKDGRISWD